MADGTSVIGASDQRWFITQRWQAYQAEARANLLRIVAVGAFYMVHLGSYCSSRAGAGGGGFWRLAKPGEIGYHFHVLMTLIAVAWAMLALGILVALQNRFFPRWLPYFSTGCDVVLLSTAICIGAGGRSPLVAAYFLVLVVSALRLSLPLVWFATAGCALGYLCVLGASRWPERIGLSKLVDVTPAEVAVPRYHQIIVMLSIVLAGVMLGQIVRRARNLYYEAINA
jgi:hypothetical protein